MNKTWLVAVIFLSLAGIMPVAAQPELPIQCPIAAQPQPLPESITPTDLPLLAQAQQADPARYQYALDQGAHLLPTDDGKSFYLLWYPEDKLPDESMPMIVTLHGHGSWALDEFYLWHEAAADYGYGILAWQWWFGEGEQYQDYYDPRVIYPMMARVLCPQAIQPQTVLFHGFSRGAANSYAVVFADREFGNHFFGMSIANAGEIAEDFPANVDIVRGGYGATPFQDTRWILYCGALDPHPERDGCVGMAETETWLKAHGATITLFIQDADGDHGGFHRNPANIRAALDTFAAFLAEQQN